MKLMDIHFVITCDSSVKDDVILCDACDRLENLADDVQSFIQRRLDDLNANEVSDTLKLQQMRVI